MSSRRSRAWARRRGGRAPHPSSPPSLPRPRGQRSSSASIASCVLAHLHLRSRPLPLARAQDHRNSSCTPDDPGRHRASRRSPGSSSSMDGSTLTSGSGTPRPLARGQGLSSPTGHGQTTMAPLGFVRRRILSGQRIPEMDGPRLVFARHAIKPPYPLAIVFDTVGRRSRQQATVAHVRIANAWIAVLDRVSITRNIVRLRVFSVRFLEGGARYNTRDEL